MPVIKGLEWTFNTVASEYDKWNPTYVPELYNDIFTYKEVNQASEVLEVGIGTGQATEPILETGCTLTAVEIGDKLAEFTRQKFSKYSKLTVVNIPFQDFQSPGNSYDLIYSARAFHWIPEEIGYTKVYQMLKSGGVFARFANHPFKDKGREQIHLALQKIYAVYMPGILSDVEYSEEASKNRAGIAKKYGFVDIDYKLYHRTRTFNAKEYVALLGTYSDHVAIEEKTRQKFFAEIQKAIEDLGNVITLYDTIALQLARKP